MQKRSAVASPRLRAQARAKGRVRLLAIGRRQPPSVVLRQLRAIASSTAIETGESVAAIEARLKAASSRFSGLQLA